MPVNKGWDRDDWQQQTGVFDIHRAITLQKLRDSIVDLLEVKKLMMVMHGRWHMH